MEYGFCTGFATTPLFVMDYDLISDIKAAGYDYAELPVMAYCSMPDYEFEQFQKSFRSPVACNLFPPSIPLISEGNDQEIDSYLDKALLRSKLLGIGKIVLGSAKARSYDTASLSYSSALRRFREVVEGIVVPKAEKYSIDILLEPMRRGECNLINTLREGYEFASSIPSSRFALMADIHHMENNGENIADLRDSFDLIHHIHIADKDRNLRSVFSDSYVLDGLSIIRESGYNETISFETDAEDMENALKSLISRTEK